MMVLECIGGGCVGSVWNALGRGGRRKESTSDVSLHHNDLVVCLSFSHCSPPLQVGTTSIPFLLRCVG